MFTQFCEAVATRVAGPREQAAAVGFDWEALLAAIMQIVMSLLEDCPASDAKTAEACKSPGILQRIWFRSRVYRELRDTQQGKNILQHTGPIVDGLSAETSERSEADLLAVVFEVRNPDWLAI